MKFVDEFFAFVREREGIRLRRRVGQPPPWTHDEVLRDWWFCNVFREDDKVTAWFRENIRDPLDMDDNIVESQLVTATAAFRWFNFIPTGEVLKPILLRGWDGVAARKALRARPLKQILGPAYIIASPPGMDRVDGLCYCIDTIHEAGYWIVEACTSLQRAHERLMQVPFLGRFMAYEIVTDLRHTDLLCRAPDILTWASIGPGSAKGLGWVHGVGPGKFRYGSKRDQATMLGMLAELLGMSRDGELWPWSDKPWEMREVEHSLCEFSKYRSAQTGTRQKRRYRCT